MQAERLMIDMNDYDFSTKCTICRIAFQHHVPSKLTAGRKEELVVGQGKLFHGVSS